MVIEKNKSKKNEMIILKLAIMHTYLAPPIIHDIKAFINKITFA